MPWSLARPRYRPREGGPLAPTESSSAGFHRSLGGFASAGRLSEAVMGRCDSRAPPPPGPQAGTSRAPAGTSRAPTGGSRPRRPHQPPAGPRPDLTNRDIACAKIMSAMPPSRSFGRDPGLQARMLFTAFLLGLIYVVLIAVLVAA